MDESSNQQKTNTENLSNEVLTEHLSDYFHELLELKEEVEYQEENLEKLKKKLKEKKNKIYYIVPNKRVTDNSIFEESVLRCHGHKFHIKSFVVQDIEPDPVLDIKEIIKDKDKD